MTHCADDVAFSHLVQDLLDGEPFRASHCEVELLRRGISVIEIHGDWRERTRAVHARLTLESMKQFTGSLLVARALVLVSIDLLLMPTQVTVSIVGLTTLFAVRVVPRPPLSKFRVDLVFVALETSRHIGQGDRIRTCIVSRFQTERATSCSTPWKLAVTVGVEPTSSASQKADALLIELHDEGRP